MKLNGKTGFALAAAFAATAGAVLFMLSRPVTPAGQDKRPESRRGAIAERRNAASTGKKAAASKNRQQAKRASAGKAFAHMGRQLIAEEDKYENLSTAEKRQYDRMQELSDENTFSYSRVFNEIGGMLTSDNPTLRLKAVETMMPFCEDAVLDVAPLLADKDNEVREEATNLIELGLNGMEDEKERIDVIAKILKADAFTADTFRLCRTHIEMMDDKIAALEIVLPAMETTRDPDIVAELKDTYKFITDEDYVDFDHAQAWADKFAQEQAEEQEAGSDR